MLNYRVIANKLAIENEGLKRQLEGKDVLIRALVEKVYSLEDTIKKMEEEMGTLKRMHFGTSSEKTHQKVSNESAKTDNEPISVSDNPEEKPTIQEHPKRKGIYKHPERRNYDDIPVEKVIELKPDAEEIKGAKYVKTVSSYRFYWIPGRLCKVRIDRKYYCKDGRLIYPDLPYVPETFEKRHADPTLAAAVLVNKYMHHIPYERQLNMINYGSFKIAKTTLFDCATAGIDALQGVYEAIKEGVLQDKILHIDETTQNMINKEEHKVKKGYDWGFIGQSCNLMFFARSNGSRKEEVLDKHLKHFSGYIHTDGYGAYTKVAERTGNDIVQIPCMSHIRRKFFDAIPYHRKWAEQGLQLINRMFTLERLMKKKKLKPNDKKRMYQKIHPLIDREMTQTRNISFSI